MFKRSISISVAIILLQFSLASASSRTKAEKDAQQVAHVKAEVAKRGTGEKAQVTVKTANGKTLKGFINEAGVDSFVVMESTTCLPVTVAYAEVAKIGGKAWSASQKILFALGVLAVVSVVLFPHGKD
jgi:propanediol dehydratase small subunit